MIYVFGDYQLDTQRYELRHGNTPCPLERQGFNVLVYLVQHRDRVVTKDELMEQLWPHQSVSENTLTQRLRAVRRALGDSGREQRVIKTVHGRGYRFIADVEERVPGDIASSARQTPVVELFAPSCPRCEPGVGNDYERLGLGQTGTAGGGYRSDASRADDATGDGWRIEATVLSRSVGGGVRTHGKG